MIYAIVDENGMVIKTIQGDEETAKLNTPEGFDYFECSELNAPHECFYDRQSSCFIKIPVSDDPFKHFDIKLKRFVYNVTLDQAKERQWEAVKQQRDTAVKSPIDFNGNTFDADESSLASINDALLSGRESINWTTHGNSVISMSSEELKHLLIAIADRKITLYERSQELRESIINAKTIEDVFSFTY